ncbi:hypothetical protein HOY80DRAFT_1041816 [Tuber brumale]|nr:hypothetical protein HOY80DRAFT_1041816 [Tuber brumale]
MKILATVDREAKIQGLTGEEVKKAEEEVYRWIAQYLKGEGYPSDTNKDYKEANINNLVSTVLIPVIARFNKETGLNLRFWRAKTIIAKDGEMRGDQEFVIINLVNVGNQKFVFVGEAEKSSLRKTKKECLLAMKDMG